MPDLPHFVEYRYTPRYDSKDLEGIDIEPKPWNIQDEISSRTPAESTLLDVGCGPAKKLMPLAKEVKDIIGVDVNEKVIENAKKNIFKAKIKNIILLQGDAFHLPIGSRTIDTITFILSRHSSQEAYRVLKESGYIIIERMGEQDIANIKAFFGNDETGAPRGYRSEMKKGEIRETHERDLQQAGFSNITSKDGFWKTQYTRDELIHLLQETPAVKDFNIQKDQSIIDELCEKLMENGKITTTQHRVLIIAQKLANYN
ncbi:MAG: class I SAM-dependent methyltransferase [Patescibacteria group bacterium]